MLSESSTPSFEGGGQERLSEQAPAFPHHNLPASLTSFVGRERDVLSLTRFLQGNRLLTLTGPGGSGKTRLALEVARRQLKRYPDGVFYVSLASLDDPELVLESIGTALGVQEQPTEPLLATLSHFLASRELLLLLDNFEHLLGAAPGIGQLLSAAPGLAVLATSREPLRLYGEQEFPVAPLALPAADAERAEELLRAPAVQLFVERARAVRPSLETDLDAVRAVAAICALLDGLPLAIELAAARTRLFAPQALLARLQGASVPDQPRRTLRLLGGGPRNRPERQQKLRATIDWSYHLLQPQEQALFRRLAVFAGGSTLEAVEAVCLAGDEAETLIDRLSSLVEKNLVVVADGPDGQPRFSLLYVMREYAGERLQRQSEAEAVGRRHAAYYFGLVRQLDNAMASADAASTLNRLETEHDNLRAALLWAETHNGLELALPAAANLANFWGLRGHAAEGRRWMERLLARSDESAPALRAAGLYALGLLANHRDDDHAARAAIRQALAFYREADDRHGCARCLMELGTIHRWQGEHEQARPLLEECERLARDLDDRFLSAGALLELGLIALYERNYAQARPLFARMLQDGEATDSRWVMAVATAQQGVICSEQGEHAPALEYLQRGLELIRPLKSLRAEANILMYYGQAAVRAGRLAQARSHLAQALHIYVDLDLWGKGLSYTLSGLAAIALAQGQDERAARLCAGAEFFSAGHDLELFAREEHEQLRETVRARLAPAAFRQTWTEGERLAASDRDAFIAFALEETPPAPAASAPTGRPFDLTPRQLQVLRLVAQGLTDADVAAQLVISPRTVNNHLTTIYQKLAVTSRTAAARVAQEHDLF